MPEAASPLCSSAEPVERRVLGSQGSPAALEHKECPREAAALGFLTLPQSLVVNPQHLTCFPFLLQIEESFLRKVADVASAGGAAFVCRSGQGI